MEIVLHKRPEKGLLAGMWELPNLEGHLGKEEVEAMFPAAFVSRLPDGKHIFSHVEWRLWCYEIKLSGGVLPEALRQDSGSFTLQKIKEQISLPSAFDCCKNYMEDSM